MNRILLTCPPMLKQVALFHDRFTELGWDVIVPEFTQVMAEERLMATLPDYDGWIIGDDPATRAVFEAGRKGRLRAAVKWGIGVDNVDFAACKDLGIPIVNTPGMFGGEVADVGMSYVLALAREIFQIDRGVRAGGWPKPAGMSLAGKTLGLIGLGDIGCSLARRALACDMNVVAWDPGFAAPPEGLGVEMARWPERIGEADFLAFTCALNASNFHMLDAGTLNLAKDGVRVVNVARGPLIDEAALIDALSTGKVRSAALDVFEIEPLPADSPLRAFDQCIFGSHNGSNTIDAVVRASHQAIDRLAGFLADTTPS